jgi:hypothetical protein
MKPEITIENETVKSVTILIEGDKIEKAVILKKDLVEYAVDNGMNILEMCNADCTDMDEVELDAATYVNDNLLDVAKEYYFAA